MNIKLKEVKIKQSMAKKRKLNSTNPKYKKKTVNTGPVDIFEQRLICTTKEGVKVYATHFKETKHVTS